MSRRARIGLALLLSALGGAALGLTVGADVSPARVAGGPALSAEQSAVSLAGASNTRLSYPASNGLATGLLSWPRPPINSNRRLIVYLHPTTGLSDRCAPSLVSKNSYFNDDGWRRQLQQLLEAGYTIFQPDYLGLGTPGRHPFLDLPANIPALHSGIHQAFRQRPELSGQYLLLGYSQGAALALAAAERAALFPGQLQGTVSVAPPAYLATQLQAGRFLTAANGQAALAIYLLAGLGQERFLSTAGRQALAASQKLCVLEFVGLTIRRQLTVNDVLAPGSWGAPERQRLLELIEQRTTVSGPLAAETLLLSGRDDRTVFPGLVELLGQELAASGSSISYQQLNAEHFSLPRIAWPRVQSFIDTSFSDPGAKFTLPLSANKRRGLK